MKTNLSSWSYSFFLEVILVPFNRPYVGFLPFTTVRQSNSSISGNCVLPSPVPGPRLLFSLLSFLLYLRLPHTRTLSSSHNTQHDSLPSGLHSHHFLFERHTHTHAEKRTRQATCPKLLSLASRLCRRSVSTCARRQREARECATFCTRATRT